MGWLPMTGQNHTRKFDSLSKSCTQLMIGEQCVDCAMLELGGWDTLNNQDSLWQRSHQS